MGVGPSDVNRSELLADVREGFDELEAAISTAAPERCRRWVSTTLYEQVIGLVRDLTDRGHRRVHGAFEILNVEVLSLEPATALSPARAKISLSATSSLLEVDREQRVIQGSEQPMAWTQALVASRGETTGRWIISELGAMTVQGAVTGPTGPRLESSQEAELEKLGRGSEERANAFTGATLSNIINLRYPNI